MTKPKVWFVDRAVWPGYSVLDKLEVLWEKSGLREKILKDRRVFIKTHFGAYGNLNALRPPLLHKMVNLVKSRGAQPILVESCGAGYGKGGVYGGRTTAPDYLEMAASNGYSFATMGAPMVFIDGYWGTDIFYVPIKGKHLEKVAVGMALRDADIVIMMTHFKGHHGTGMGGTLKNLGIGCVGKYSKAMMHAPSGPITIPEKCKGRDCSQPCIRVCPERCITIDPKVEIDMSKCIRCQHCSSACGQIHEERAIVFRWGENGAGPAERTVENAWGVLQGVGSERFFFFNVAFDISQTCDCAAYGPTPLSTDVGIFASWDPVAVDKASLDGFNNAPAISASVIGNLESGEDKFEAAYSHRYHHRQLEYAEELGLGSRAYKLVKVDRMPP